MRGIGLLSAVNGHTIRNRWDKMEIPDGWFDRTGFVPRQQASRRGTMAKKAAASDRVYKLVEVIGTSTESWEDAGKNAVETAALTLRDLRIAEVVKMDMKVEGGKVLEYRMD